MRRFLPILLVSCLSSAWGSEEHFEKHIRPLLIEHCIKCHGPQKQKGGLRLDSAAGWKVGGDSGPAITPGDASASRLMKAVSYTDRDLKMPPDGKLPAEAVSALEQWITLGAHDPRKGDVSKGGAKVIDPRQHWAFQLPKDSPPPAVKDGSWPKNPIDHFILAKLEAAQLKPAPAADAAVLARRLSYDLTGLPGMGADIPALLASPQYAERWAQHWLDVARFAESSGGGRTLPFKDAWRYRDYVIQSIKDDVPLDRFIEEQVAGDLMPHESPEQRRRQLTATGYLVLGAHNYEEQDKDLLRMDIVDEQLDTIGKSLLGMTITCARCHDHKFDPIPTRDYYALAGIFRSSKVIRDPKENVAHWVDAPLPLDGPAESEMQEHESLVKAKEQDLAEAKKALKKLSPKTEPKGGDSRPVAVDEIPGIVVDESQATQVGTWKHSTRYPTYVGDGYLHDDNTGKGELSLTYIPRITKGGRYEVRFAYSSVATRATNVPINILHADGETDVVVDQSVVPPIDARFISLGQYRFEANGQGFVMVSNEGTTGHVTADAVTFIPVEELEVLAAADAKPQSNPEIAAATAEVKQLEVELRKLGKKLPPRPQAMVIAEHEDNGDTKVHIRGNIRNLGDVVPRGFIQAAFHEKAPPQMPAGQSGRLQLAQWLTSGRNPLTARVLANRVWMHLFGEGLVRTVDNFGTTGEAPTHPELLDHLALYLQRNHWSLKALVRYIVESNSYRMASRPSPLAADPDNRLLHSQRRRRLDANALRDTLLATAGTLDLGFLGPNIQNAVDARDSNNTEVLNLEYGYVFADTRRSVYTPAFRNKRHELFDAFDFNDVNQSLTRRNTSSVSPQALYLLNNAFVIDVSRKAAEQLSADLSIPKIYQRVLGRAPTAKEEQLCQDFLSTQPTHDDWALLIQNLFASPDFRFLD